MKWLTLILFSFILLGCVGSFAEEAIYTGEYYVSFYPDYPPVIGEKITLRLRTFKPAQRVTLLTEREKEIPMTYRQGYWWGTFQIPPDYKPGGHYFAVWVRYPVAPPKTDDFVSRLLRFLGFKKKPPDKFWSRSLISYQMVKERPKPNPASSLVSFEAEVETEEALPVATGEALEIKTTSLEAVPFIIKGSKTISFTSRSIEGSKEGFVPGATREESLRLNIAGKSGDTEINANMISTSAAGLTQISQNEDKISVLVRKGSTEAYLGDYTADLTETEFTGLNKVLSGVKLQGDYDRWGFAALYSSPKGEGKLKKLYGVGTQGPYQLDFAPVVIDSERVYLDGVLQKRGDDYTVDYQAGTVTFIRKTIDPKSELDIYYDFRQTVYEHATYGLRLTARPTPNLKLGATYLDDSDSLAGAAEIRASLSQEAVDPQSHFVVGVDGSLVSDLLTANGEAAYSRKDLNLLAPGSEEAGKAVKLDLSSQLGPLGITAHGKRVGANFEPIAVPDPKQDVTEYGLGLSFRPGSLFGAQGSDDYARYTQSGVMYETSSQLARVSLTPERLPSLEYDFSQNKDSNDPVTGSAIERTITRNSAETLYRLGIWSTSLKGTTEKWRSLSPSEEVTDYTRLNAGVATIGLEKVTLTSNIELEDRREPSGATPHRRTYNLNLSLSPIKQYFFSTSVQYLDDSEQGIQNVTDLSYRAEPNEYFRADGKYNITTVNENYATTEVVAKHTGSLNFDLRPARWLRLRYLYKPNFTLILSANTRSYNNEQQQTEINLLPLSDVMVGALIKTGRAFSVMPQNYYLKQNSADDDSVLYTLKLAPFRIFSTEFDYLLDNGRSTQLATSEPAAYIPGQSFNKKFDAMVKTSLSERFSIDSRYTYQFGTQGSGESAANLADSVSHTASLQGTWNVNDLWSFSLSGAYTRTRDNLSAVPVTYTYSPGCGFIYRQGDRLRVDGNLTYSRSYAGADTELYDYSLRAKYGLSDFVNVTLTAERQFSRAPDFKLTDISGLVEINL